MAIRQGKTLFAFRRCVLATFLIAAPAAHTACSELEFFQMAKVGLELGKAHCDHPRAHSSHCCFLPKSRAHARNGQIVSASVQKSEKHL